jgi:putative MFS transporter
VNREQSFSARSAYWTAFIGLFFDYYDLYLFVYLDKVLAAEFGLGVAASSWLQFTGLAGVGLGSLAFGLLADRFGRGRIMLATFAVYLLGIAGISCAWDAASLFVFRLIASLALGAEWGISHAYLAERVDRQRLYRYSALLQFSILGGLLAALAVRFVGPVTGWRVLFAASLVPVIVLSALRWNALREHDGTVRPQPRLAPALREHARPFLICLALSSLTIASGTMNVYFAKDLPQGPFYTILFWGSVAPGMLLGAGLVRRLGVRPALGLYAAGIIVLSVGCWLSRSPDRSLAFAVALPLLNGVPFGLMGAYFNEVFGSYRTMLSGAAYNLGRILAGFSPVALAAWNLQVDGRYFLFTAALGLAVSGVAMSAPEGRRSRID